MRSPLHLCEKLGLTPTPGQHELLTRLGQCHENYNIQGDEKNESARACAIFALWRVLNVSDSLGIVLTPSKERSNDFMTFITAVTKRCSPELASVSGFPRWNVLQVGGRTGWELRLMPNKAALVRERAPNAVVSLILDAGNSDPEFVEAVRALEERSTHEKNTLIHLW
jgi:hypothetical protein